MTTPAATPSRPSALATATSARSAAMTSSTPAYQRPSATATSAPSPAYITRDHKRHSLYGTEDRIILDPGASLWKVGFSGEARPRAVFRAAPGGSPPEEGIWEEEFEPVARRDGWHEEDEDETEGGIAEREWGETVVDGRIRARCREVFGLHLMTDPKSRKLIVLENPLLPTRIKEMIARCLFEDLQVPSISFIPPQVLSLLAIGRTSGLVVDIGFLETVVLPINLSRPLYSHLASTPLAARYLHRSLRLLLLHFATYIPPIASLSAAALGASGRLVHGERPTEEILARRGVLERVLTSGCFVGSMMDTSELIPDELDDDDDEFGETMDVDDEPPSSTTPTTPRSAQPSISLPSQLNRLRRRFARQSSTRELAVPVPNHPGEGLGSGTLLVPGWVRERIAEDLFAFRRSKDADLEREEESVVGVVLGVLAKLPIDLRAPMASNILVTGGTSMLPGFIPRLRASLLAALDVVPSDNASREPSSSSSSIPSSPPATLSSPRRHSPQTSRSKSKHPYFLLLPLRYSIALLNDPTPPRSFSSAKPFQTQGGTAPAFAPSLLPWIGGSLAGALRSSGRAEVARDQWDEARERRVGRERRRVKVERRKKREGEGKGEEEEEKEDDEEDDEERWARGGVEVLGDWTRWGVYGVGR